MCTLAKGSKGAKVKELQLKLSILGLYRYNADGVYGAKTKNAVAAFQQSYLVDGICDDITRQTLEAAVQSWATVKDKHVLLKVPHGLEQIICTFGEINFVEAGAGDIEITNGWDEDNIVQQTLPVVGAQMIHKKMVPVFASVLQNIKDKGLDKLVKQFGCWCPRHKMHNPKRSLSTHSWAIACDINWAENPVGKVGNMDPGIVASFESHGFNWGGRWSHRDDMHFQYANGY